MFSTVHGSFTGVRIGIATIKAFSDALNLPVVSVSSLEGLAYNLIDTKLLDNTIVCSIIDAKNRNVYCGIYQWHNNSLNQITDLMAQDIDTTISKINSLACTRHNQANTIAFVGDGSIAYYDLLKDNIKFSHLIFAENEKNNANSVSIAIGGAIKYQNGEFGNSSILSPIYLRKSQAERALEGEK